MKPITLKAGTKVEFYYGIKELPADRWNDFQKLFLQEAGIGSDMEAVGQHLSQLFFYLQNNKIDQARQETINLHNNYYNMIEGLSVKSFAMAAFIHSIDGKPFDTSKDVGEVLKYLSKKGLTYAMIGDIIDEVKKKLIANFNPIFLTDTPMQVEGISL